MKLLVVEVPDDWQPPKENTGDLIRVDLATGATLESQIVKVHELPSAEELGRVTIKAAHFDSYEPAGPYEVGHAILEHLRKVK